MTTTDTKPETVTRYVLTYINPDGMRTLTAAMQGQNTYDTSEKAYAALTTLKKTDRQMLVQIFGENGPGSLAVRACECWPGHFDPVGRYFDLHETIRKRALKEAREALDAAHADRAQAVILLDGQDEYVACPFCHSSDLIYVEDASIYRDVEAMRDGVVCIDSHYDTNDEGADNMHLVCQSCDEESLLPDDREVEWL